MKVLRCHAGIGPDVEGEALVAIDNFSARYDLDREKAYFLDLNTHCLENHIKTRF